jgi:5-formyltetrahydrofolate cyclo-ligase
MAVPRLRGALPFIELDPQTLPGNRLWAAASIKGALESGRPVGLDEMSPINLVVAGSVAISTDGSDCSKARSIMREFWQ